MNERLSRLENQSALKREAAASAVEEQLKEKEAIEAENAAARAKIAENEAMVSFLFLRGCIICHSPCSSMPVHHFSTGNSWHDTVLYRSKIQIC